MDVWRGVPSRDGENKVLVEELLFVFVEAICKINVGSQSEGSAGLGTVCQALLTITGGNFFLVSNLNLPLSRLKP